MGKIVQGTDFTDAQIKEYFDGVKRIDWSTLGAIPAWVQEQADAFAGRLPRPGVGEFRQHVDHAVAVAMGWNHPDDPTLMLSTATKSFYLLAWLDHLQKHRPDPVTPLDISLAVRVNFTPVMTNVQV